MSSETEALTDEVHAVLMELRRISGRLDDIEGRADTEQRRAWWHRLMTVAVVLLVVALTFVALEQRRSSAEGCDAIRAAFDTYTDALAGFSSESADRTPAEESAFDDRVTLFRAEIQARLANCN